MGIERAAEALAALAALHGTWWSIARARRARVDAPADDPVNLAAGQQYRDAWPMFVERIGDALPPGRSSSASGSRAQFEEISCGR